MNNNDTVKTKSEGFFANKYNLIVLVSGLATFALWLIIQAGDQQTSKLNYSFAFMLGLMPFLASFKGLTTSKKWGGTKSVLGKAVTALSIGLLLWSLGEFTWSFYNLFLGVDAPYPSLADLGYATGVTFWIISALYLAKLAGVNLLVKTKPNLRMLAIGIVVASIVVSYVSLVQFARGGVLLEGGGVFLKSILDIAYPLGDMISLTIVALVVTVGGRYLGGLLKLPVMLVVIGLFSSFLYDLSFSYTTTQGTYYNGQKSDILLLLATGLMALGLLMFAERGKTMVGQRVAAVTPEAVPVPLPVAAAETSPEASSEAEEDAESEAPAETEESTEEKPVQQDEDEDEAVADDETVNAHVAPSEDSGESTASTSEDATKSGDGA